MFERIKYFSAKKASGLIAQVLVDIALINLSMLIAMYLKFDLHIPKTEMWRLSNLWPIMTALCLISFAISRMYRSLWQYASVQEALQIVIGTLMGMGATFVFSIVSYTMYKTPNYFMITSRTVYPIAWFVLLLLTIAQRFSFRVLKSIDVKRPLHTDVPRKRVMIVGAGWAGATMLREFAAVGFKHGLPVVAVDDDPKKAGTHLGRIKVLYGIVNIPEYAKEYMIDEIVIAIPTATPDEMRLIMEACTATDCELKLVPGMRDITDGQLHLGQLRDVSISDLLYRDEVKLDMQSIRQYLTGQTVLVTGGGGSIGSELCRQIAKFNPSQLIIFDIYENSSYLLVRELRAKYGDELNVSALIGSIQDQARLDAVFDQCRPDVVFHAAAHKHVPLMEVSPTEAVKNNVFGTYNVARCADRHGVKRFVLISTDKAINPPNVYGATKRATEMVLQYMTHRSKTQFMAVRFGNVLGSNGSVIPLFREQIAKGGPVTVTHPDITRYFMTIPEAAQLVLQAGGLGENGTIFVLDMGTPVKIVDLAKNLIRLSGYQPDTEIKIAYTGLRPGEKMYEELMMADERETMSTTHHDKIYVIHPPQLDDAAFMAGLQSLRLAISESPADLQRCLKALVPTYHPSEDAEPKLTTVTSSHRMSVG